jgi:hypothetical protein
MAKHIEKYQSLAIKGSCIVEARSATSQRLLHKRKYKNTILTAWKNEFAKDLKSLASEAPPRALAFTRDVVAASPEPTSLGANEFRDSVTRFNSGNKLILVCILSSHEGNGAGNLKSMGLYFKSTATTTVGTGSLGTLINTLDEPKDTSVELSFQYEITFG